MNTNRTFETSRTAIVLGLCLVVAGFGIVGCQNTAEGVATDAKKDTAVVENAADRAGDATKKAADNAVVATKKATGAAVESTKHAAGNTADATTLTPKVKNAIINNKTLNNPKNLINVDSRDGIVHLKGHVVSADEKKLAGEVAARAVADSGSKDKVSNELAVQ